MSLAMCLKQSLELPEFVIRSYLEDLSDAELLIRPAPDMNHIAWQLGHLIASERDHVEAMFPGTMPKLPKDFADQHSRETSCSNAAQDFLLKHEYLELMRIQRCGTVSVLQELTDAQLMQEAPESLRYFGPTVACVFSGEASHWMMHAGQWAVVRRKLGRPPLF